MASLAFVFSLSVILAPQAAFALDEPTPEPPATVLPATCTALLTTSPTPETPPANEPAWSPLVLTAPQRTNTAPLQWNWTIPTALDAANQSSLHGYGYALFNGDTLVTSGELSADVQQYSYAASSNGTYRLFVWVLDTITDPATPVATGCEYADTTYDTVGPYIIGDSYIIIGNTANPLFSTDETDVTYSWTVNAGDDMVLIDGSTNLNPTFTFLADGAYTFKLVATDSLGNVTNMELIVTYIAPFIPGPEVLLPPTIPAPIDPYVPPAIVKAETERTVAVGASYQAAMSTDVVSDPAGNNASNVASANRDSDSASSAATGVQPVQSSAQGWLILGVPWYWWLLGLAIIVSAVQWYRSGAFRKSPDDL